MSSMLPRMARKLLRGRSGDFKVLFLEMIGYYFILHEAMGAGGEDLQRAAMDLRLRVKGYYAENAGGLGEVLSRNAVPRRRLLLVIDGWSLLLYRQRPRDWKQLETTLELTGGSMALALGPAMGLNAEEQERGLMALGKAIVLTQLLAHLRHHLNEGRLPFAESDMERFRVPLNDIAQGIHTPQFHDLMWFQVKRIEEWLLEGEGLKEALDRKERKFITSLVEWQRELLKKAAGGAG